MTLMQTGASWLGARLKTAAGRSVTIDQGNITLAAITGWVSMHDYDIVDADGALTSVTSYDWSFLVADLNGLKFHTGARITEVLNGVTSVYEAMPLGNRKAAEPMDTSGLLVTVHSKLVRDDA